MKTPSKSLDKFLVNQMKKRARESTNLKVKLLRQKTNRKKRKMPEKLTKKQLGKRMKNLSQLEVTFKY
jgi:hypothetical protein